MDIRLSDIQDILTNNDPQFIEQLAERSKKITEQYFGRTISLYTPLYISNYCSSQCTYCGFSSNLKIKRAKLTTEQIDREMSFIAKQGIESILLLTGESYTITDINYLLEAVAIARNYFPHICLEVHPIDTDEYATLYRNGVDCITIYQETYDQKQYSTVHLSGKKRDYWYRKNAPERIALSGIRHISLGVLLGLGPLETDLLALYEHLRYMEKHFPGVEYSVSFPRLKKIPGVAFDFTPVDDIALIKILCLTRILFPRTGINLSTRESAFLRDRALGLGVTRISAGSNTSVGGYSITEREDQNPQFDIADTRSIKEIVQLLKTRNFDPVLTNWRRIENREPEKIRS